MAIIMNMGEGYFVGIFSILEKIFRMVAKSDNSKKMEKVLLERYCGYTF